MITVFVKKNNPLTPNFYNQILNSIQLHQLTCPCGHSGCLSVHGYYHRFVKTPMGIMRFRICRVLCECCGHTHAILLSSMVPYSQISLMDHVTIITNHEQLISQHSLMDYNPLIDENCIRYVLRQYISFWKQKLLSERISLSGLHDIISSCFSHFGRQFMQIKSTPNILFLYTT